jgi:hypothetical protein
MEGRNLSILLSMLWVNQAVWVVAASLYLSGWLLGKAIKFMCLFEEIVNI